MKTLTTLSFVALFVPAVVSAQTPVAQATPKTAPAPQTAPTPMTPPTALAPMAVVAPDLSGLYKLDMERYREQALALQGQADLMRVQARAFEEAQQTLASAWSQADAERSAYDRGQTALSQRQYDVAIQRFDQVIAAKGARVDGALYWKAFAQFKLGRSADANATLGELQKSFRDSKYTPDAKVLEAEIKRTGGQAARPEAEDDEDIKLLALQGLINSDPERAIPLVQGVLSSASSLKLKDRALYVLALSTSPQAHTILVNTAKGGTPDLQVKAINYLGVNRGREGGKTTIAELVEIYHASQNDAVKRAVISAIGAANRTGLMAYGLTTTGERPVVISGQTPVAATTAAREAARAGAATNRPVSTEGQAELWSIYQKETSTELKGLILSTLGMMGATDRILEVARTEKDPDLRNRAIRSLGSMRMTLSGTALVDLYPNLPDAAAKKSVISALGNQDNAEALIAIARKESDRELKRAIVERLVNMPKNKAAQDYLMEIIK